MLKKLTVALSLVLAGLMVGEAQITVPHTFTTTVPVSQLNTNFSTIADGALKRSGGNVTGAITADSGITIDGVDIGAVLGASSASVGVFQQLTTSNTGATSVDFAGGITAGTGNVAIVNTAGKIPALSSTYFADLSAANMTVDGSTQLDDYIYSATTYTPTWTAVTANPTLGNGVITGRYLKVGRQITVNVQLTIGSTTTFGTGQWIISLPTTTSSSGLLAVGQVLVYDTSAGGIPYLGAVVASANASTGSLVVEAAPITGTAPITFAVDDKLHFTLTYESAS